jgi:hypothetical protein
MRRPFRVAVPVAVRVAFWVAIRTAPPSGAGNSCTASVSEVHSAADKVVVQANEQQEAVRVRVEGRGGTARTRSRAGRPVRSGLCSGIRSGVRSGVRSGPDPPPLRETRAQRRFPFSRSARDNLVVYADAQEGAQCPCLEGPASADLRVP